jgi:spore coat polysaccharide biosynthesis protein SpsF
MEARPRRRLRRLACVAGIQARLSSRRLPGKVLADLGGKPLIQRVYERTRAARLVDQALVLTSSDASDDALVEFLERARIPYRRGPLDDVLARYLALVDEFEPRFVLRVTGDFPFVEPAFLDAQLQTLLDDRGRADLVHVRGNESGAVEGTLGGQNPLSKHALRFAGASPDPRDREHVGSFFLARNRHRFRQVELEVDAVYHRPGLRLAVDEPADLALARAVWTALDGRGDGLFSTADAIRWIDAHPALRALNAHVQESADNRALRSLTRGREEDPGPPDAA